MNYLLLYWLLLSYWRSAPPDVVGLGQYSIGVTTPELLNKTVFEEHQAYAKGTLALVCSHIRLFSARTAEVDGIRINNLSLAFYDSKLFTISCDYTPALQSAFVEKHGQGDLLSPIRSWSCIKGQDKPLVIGGKSWKNGDIQAVAVQVEGYNADCRLEDAVWLIIGSQRVISLSSDCDLGNRSYLCDRLVNGQRP